MTGSRSRRPGVGIGIIGSWLVMAKNSNVRIYRRRDEALPERPSRCTGVRWNDGLDVEPAYTSRSCGEPMRPPTGPTRDATPPARRPKARPLARPTQAALVRAGTLPQASATVTRAWLEEPRPVAQNTTNSLRRKRPTFEFTGAGTRRCRRAQAAAPASGGMKSWTWNQQQPPARVASRRGHGLARPETPRRQRAD